MTAEEFAQIQMQGMENLHAAQTFRLAAMNLRPTSKLDRAKKFLAGIAERHPEWKVRRIS